MLHPIYFLPTLYTDTDMSIFGRVIVLAFQICILLMGFTASFSKGTQLYESWHEFPIDLLYKDVSSLDTKWRILASCPNSQYIGTLVRSLVRSSKVRLIKWQNARYNKILWVKLSWNYKKNIKILSHGVKKAP